MRAPRRRVVAVPAARRPPPAALGAQRSAALAAALHDDDDDDDDWPDGRPMARRRAEPAGRSQSRAAPDAVRPPMTQVAWWRHRRRAFVRDATARPISPRASAPPRRCRPAAGRQRRLSLSPHRTATQRTATHRDNATRRDAPASAAGRCPRPLPPGRRRLALAWRRWPPPPLAAAAAGRRC